MTMEYRRLGRAGLRVSVLSYGSWLTFSDPGRVRECLSVAADAGVNFFDTAEVYDRGGAERMLGSAIEGLGWDRRSFVLSTKLYWGIHDTVNLRNTLNRKYLLQGVDGCLERLRTSFVDILFCHRPDPHTPIEEVVWTMSDIVASGKALYWGTSEWPAAQIRAAWQLADRHGLRKPVVEQPEYNLFARGRVERELRPLCDELGLGLATWSPLASGLLSGKYRGGVPPGSRGGLPGYGWLRGTLTDPERNARVTQLGAIAHDMGCTTAQLAIAWCTSNPAVSSVITGASDPRQLRENLAALAFAPAITPAIASRIDAVFARGSD